MSANAAKGIFSLSFLFGRQRLITGLFVCFIFVMAGSCKNKDNDATKATKDTAGKAGSDRVAVKTILFFGNSLTAGYGLEPEEAFPALIQHTIDSLQLPYKVVNAGVSGETSAGGNGRINWILQQRVDVFVLELGGNDGLRGIPAAETSMNLQSIIDRVKAKYPDARLLLAGMQVPPNMGQQYATDFEQMYPQLATKNGLVLIPFLLKGVGGEAILNQRDGIHPNIAGAKIVAGNVWQYLQKVL